MISSLSKYPIRRRRNSKCSTVTSVISGLVRVVSGLQNSRKAHAYDAFSYRRRLSLVVRWLVRSPLDGRLVAMAYRKILSPRQTVPLSGHWFARQKLWMHREWITDPYELYEHMHPSDVGTCIGSGMGGVTSMAQMFKDRRDEKRVQNDILQET